MAEAAEEELLEAEAGVLNRFRAVAKEPPDALALEDVEDEEELEVATVFEDELSPVLDEEAVCAVESEEPAAEGRNVGVLEIAVVFARD